EVVTLRERDGGRTDEFRVEAVDRARRIAEHAVDAHAVLLVVLELLRGLPILTLGDRLLHLPYDPWLDAHQFPHEVPDVDDEVADDRKVAKRLDPDRSGRVVAEERGACELGLAVDGHPAAAADAHPARPPVRQRAIEAVLDVVQTVEDHP